MTIHEDISRITKQLLYVEPFYAYFLISLNKTIDNKMPALAGVRKVGINIELVINENMWNELKDEHKVAVLKHELLHIVFYHLVIKNNFVDKQIFNIACDLEVNQYVENLPEWAVTLDCFPHLKLEKNAGARRYYEILMEHKQDEDVQNILSQMPGGKGSHGAWEEIQVSETEGDLIKKQIDYQMKEIVNNKDRGIVPGELKSIIDELFKITPAVFDWKAYLRRFLGNSNIIYTKKTRRKPNKRYPDSPALKIKKRSHILVAVDTSGSVSDGELEEFFSEIYHIYKAGCMVTVLQCDADVHDVREYKGKFDGRITGRGGTSFDPPIEYYNKYPGKFTTFIYLTDAYAPMPVDKPRGTNMMWVISSKGQNLDQIKQWPGHKIKIP